MLGDGVTKLMVDEWRQAPVEAKYCPYVARPWLAEDELGPRVRVQWNVKEARRMV